MWILSSLIRRCFKIQTRIPINTEYIERGHDRMHRGDYIMSRSELGKLFDQWGHNGFWKLPEERKAGGWSVLVTHLIGEKEIYIMGYVENICFHVN